MSYSPKPESYSSESVSPRQATSEQLVAGHTAHGQASNGHTPDGHTPDENTAATHGHTPNGHIPSGYIPNSQTGSFSVEQWLTQAIAREGVRVRSQCRGNDLHLLCESEKISPDRYTTLSQLVYTLRDADLDLLTPANQPKIYRIRLYGCVIGYNRPSWTELIELNQLDRYLVQLQEISRSLEAFGSIQPKRPIAPTVTPPIPADISPTVASAPAPIPFTPTDISLSNRTLAQQGDINAIATYLSETLSEYGVAVQVSIKTLAYTPTSTIYGVNPDAPDTQTSKRLWIACQAAYSPEPCFISEPIAQKLRDLEIEGFRDAVILFQVVGEARPDWMLRVNLTPALEMLKEWARWGDIAAIQRLINHELVNLNLHIVSAVQNEATLHLICTELPQSLASTFLDPDSATPPRSGSPVVLNHELAKTNITTLLETIAPQGIHAVSIYGQLPDQENPAWMDWHHLPASIHPALAETPLTLAKENDWGAIAFLLHRLLNLDLDKYLATGGIRIQLLPKQNLLHLMCEAAICPDQREITPLIINLLEQLQLSHLEGLRIYGRRAGQKHPLWNYAHTFGDRISTIPEPIAKGVANFNVAANFVATDAYVDELLAKDGEPVLRPDLTPDDIWGGWQRSQHRLVEGIRWLCVRSQLFIHEPIENQTQGRTTKKTTTKTITKPLSRETSYANLGMSLVWSAFGLLLMLQTNWVLTTWVQTAKAEAQKQATSNQRVAATLSSGEQSETRNSGRATSQVAQASQDQVSQDATVGRSRHPVSGNPSNQQTANENPSRRQTPRISLRQSRQADPSAFNASGFTRPPTEPEKGSFSFNPEMRADLNPSAANNLDQGGAPTLPYTPETQQLRLETVEILTHAKSLPTFNSHQLNEKLQLYYNFLEASGPPDVLIVGSSRALRGVDPIALQTALADLGYKDAKIFNFGINGATVQVVDLLLRRLLKPNQMPRLIVWADGARAFNSGTKDVTYDGIVASEAYRQLTAGTLQLPTVPADASVAAAAASTPTINTTLTQSYQSLDRLLSQGMATVITVHQDRDRLKHLLQAQFAHLFPIESQAAVAATSSELSPNLSTRVQQGQPIMNPLGFLSLSVQFNPATYYQKFAKVSGQYDSDYSDFRITGVQAEVLNTFLSYTRSRKIPVVFVNLPLTDAYLDPLRSQYEEEFRRYLVSVSVKQPGLIFRDFSEQWTDQYQYFSDPSHLNRYGAYAVSLRLAQDPVIPWDEAKPRSEPQE